MTRALRFLYIIIMLLPEVRGMSQSAFRLLAEQIFSLPEAAALVRRATDQQEGG